MDRLARRPNSGDATAGRTPPHRSGYPGTREEAIGNTEKPAIEVRPDHSAFSSRNVMVPMAICMRTCTRTGSLRRSSVSQTLRCAERR